MSNDCFTLSNFFMVQYWFSVVQCCCPKSLTFVVVPYCCPMLLSNVIVPIRQAWGGIPVPEYFPTGMHGFPFPKQRKSSLGFLVVTLQKMDKWFPIMSKWFNGKQLTKMVKYNRFIQFKDFLMNFIHLYYILRRGGGNSEGEVSITPMKSITSANTLPPSF